MRHDLTFLQDQTPLQEIGEIIRIERHRARLSQRALGAIVGVDGSAISRIEKGKLPQLSVATLMRLSEELGVSPAAITAPFFTDRKAHERHSEQVAS